jgi:hypothetical protein
VSRPGDIGHEPKGGDFVAYLAQIEQRQLRALQLAAPPHGPPSVAAPSPVHRDAVAPDRLPADTVPEARRQQAGSAGLAPRQFLGVLLLVLAGLAFMAGGLGADDSGVPLMIGGFLLFLAWRRFRRMLSGDSSAGDLATRLQRKT